MGRGYHPRFDGEWDDRALFRDEEDWGHFLVDDRLADELVAAGVTGLSFHNVYALIGKKRQVKMRWKQMHAPHILPPVAPQTTGLHQERPCKLCNRSGYCTHSEDPLRLAYRSADLKGALDVNSTWEGYGFATFGTWEGTTFIPSTIPGKLSVPSTLITPKVMQIFRNAGVKDVDYLPIRVVED